MWHTWWILFSNNHFLEITFTQKLYEVSYLYQDIFFQVVPNYSPTIHSTWRVSFIVEVVNVRLNTIAPMQYQAWSTGARMYNVWVLTIYCRSNDKWQILMSLKMYYPGQTEENDDNSDRIASILAKWKGAKVNWMFTASVTKMNIQPPTSSVL